MKSSRLALEQKKSGNSDNGSQCRVFIANANNTSSNS